MVDRRDVGTWLEGPRGATVQAYPGLRLGRPENGVGSLARPGRRLAGLLVDWIASLLVARAVLGPGAWEPLVVLAVEHVVLIGTIGATLGHRVVGVRVERVDGGPPGPVAALIRTVLLVLVIPAVIWDADLRCLHDKASGTLVARR